MGHTGLINDDISDYTVEDRWLYRGSGYTVEEALVMGDHFSGHKTIEDLTVG